ncbi:unnamed protein product [Phyllotreta striolata]|uniref:tRNA-specific adenosine deaminase 1 n=1 Tax=Phyllotreta striolata TaxID=444603 RepID=A0A9N9TLY3_PHYSR|nr:unnamed protein product [Phyllotreta striolata]
MESFPDKIAEICLKCFENLPKTGKPGSQEWTVLSGIVRELEGNLAVVALGTGSKCIGRSKMSKNGDILNDSHAEIICKRSFIRYIYSQLEHGGDSFVWDENRKKFSLKNGVKFHFFTTQTPCGDASIFPEQIDHEIGEVIEEIPSKRPKLEIQENYEENSGKPRKIHKTGGKSLLEHSPDINCELMGLVRTKPGRGDPTLSVSCSDKLSKWVHLGLQGALLSSILTDPVYLQSFTILSSAPFNETALNRALYDRLGPIELPAPFRRTRVEIHRSSKTFEFAKNDQRRPCDAAISYSLVPVDEKRIEVAVDGKRQGLTKKQYGNPGIGRLKICKRELYEKFLHVCRLKGIPLRKNDEFLLYKEAKMLDEIYVKAKRVVRGKFDSWTVKNEGLLEFFID